MPTDRAIPGPITVRKSMLPFARKPDCKQPIDICWIKLNHRNIMMRRNLLILLLIVGLSSSAQTWIWYPGDFEIWLGNEMNNRRTERGAFFPHFWKMDSHYTLVEFSKEIELSEAEDIEIAVEGRF